ncbi:threonine/serine exporter family protein [Nocardioides terrisoli]|uniref:threonine/serine ThrE exporter family protein n=1 Tax=Nocardioides terrisoli TaxID=3388267 RepID=UPI00287B7414|nr:threonine/serine exporter family protein [Nocardioides marmorisolisilvae]
MADPEILDTWKTLDLALRVGELLLSSGAGAADVGAQMSNVAHACGLRRVSTDVTFTSLSISYQPGLEEPAIMQGRQVRHREIDYGDLTLVDHLVRDLIEGRVDRDEARARVARITSTGHGMPRWAVTLGWGVMGGGVGLMLGGDPILVVVAFVAAAGIDSIQRKLGAGRLPTFYLQVAGGLFATLLSVGVAALGINVNPSHVVTASIIMLLAGVSFMGAVQDALTGFPLTAAARLLEAMLSTAGIIAGVTGGFTVAKLAGVSLGHLHPGASAFSDVPLLTVGGVVTASAFAFASYAPIRSLLPIGLVGGLATGVYGALYEHGFDIAWSSGWAAVLVGLVSFGVAARFRVPALAVVVSAIVPLLPGLSIYRGLALLAEGSTPAGGLVSLINAAAVAIALAAGVILGEYVAQPVGREARRLEQRLAGPRLVGPLTARSLRRRK